ncbi:MAG: HAMP domain-containing histidine kinase, partial [Planctomycetaceae bacterium]|nr:HAMP domain-containing histidine kinase [Planctomycetaceae bacterium]
VFDRVEPLMVEINAGQMKQVVLNLVANALQATPAGGEVVVELQEQVDFVVLTVTDTGSGMDAETIQHIFDPLFTTKDAGQGTGLGLSITHRIIEDHHGTIVPLSKGPGCGATFRIRIPRHQPSLQAA